MLNKTFAATALSTALLAGAGAFDVLPDAQAANAGVQIAAYHNPCNPCAAKNPCNPCNPCAAANPCNPCNPCAAKLIIKNPCNPCAAANPCNPCAAANPCNPCAAAN